MASGSGGISFLGDMALKNYPCFSGWSTPMCIPLSRLRVFKTKNTRNWEGKVSGEEREGIEGDGWKGARMEE